jgi:hypothetical protein
MTGAQYEIRIDGAPRTYRDRKEYAMEVARFIKSKNPHSMVEVKRLAKWRHYRGGSSPGSSGLTRRATMSATSHEKPKKKTPTAARGISNTGKSAADIPIKTSAARLSSAALNSRSSVSL